MHSLNIRERRQYPSIYNNSSDSNDSLYTDFITSKGVGIEQSIGTKYIRCLSGNKNKEYGTESYYIFSILEAKKKFPTHASTISRSLNLDLFEEICINTSIKQIVNSSTLG